MTHHEEVWQAYTEYGEPVQRPLSRQEAAAGVLHGAAHVWLYRRSNSSLEIVVQKRAANKKTWPGYYDISAAGHINYGETPLQAIGREAREEIGLNLIPEKLRLLYVYRQRLSFDHITENELQWVYGYELAGQSDFQFADGEVESVQWLGEAAFNDLLAGKSNGRIVPHGEVYFKELIKELRWS